MRVALLVARQYYCTMTSLSTLLHLLLFLQYLPVLRLKPMAVNRRVSYAALR